MKETEIAKPVISWLQEQHWEIYQEVQCSANGPRADIVAKQGRLLWVIELKRSLSFDLIAQAQHWIGLTHFVSIATKSAKNRRGKTLQDQVLAWLGIGRITTDGFNTKQWIEPRLHRKCLPFLRDCLLEEHKTWAPAGNANSDYYSPFKATCREVQVAVKLNPGLTMRELIDKTRHHYCSDITARSALLNWIKWGKVPGVEIRRTGRFVHLYPNDLVFDKNEET